MNIFWLYVPSNNMEYNWRSQSVFKSETHVLSRCSYTFLHRVMFVSHDVAEKHAACTLEFAQFDPGERQVVRKRINPEFTSAKHNNTKNMATRSS
jgi:hypothetical protein